MHDAGPQDVRFAIVSIVLALGVGALHYAHVARSHEAATRFARLSPLGRETTLRAEQALYYSYYKRLVEARSLGAGVAAVARADPLAEHPRRVDALRRFGVHAELGAAALYRALAARGLLARECRRVAGRGDAVACDGLGEPVYFYLACVWACAALGAALLFVYALYLCESLYGAALAMLFYFYNHAEATRVQWAPPLRENFAFPFIVLNAMTVTFFLRRTAVRPNECGLLQTCTVGATGCACLVLWQFSQFVLAAQLLVLLAMHALGVIAERRHFAALLAGHLCALYLAAAITRGNGTLLGSAYAAVAGGACAAFALAACRARLAPQGSSPLRASLAAAACVACAALARRRLAALLVADEDERDDDAHLRDLLAAKFNLSAWGLGSGDASGDGAFHAALHLCSAEFDFLPWASVRAVARTGLLPCAALGVAAALRRWWRRRGQRRIEPELFFNVAQLFAFCAMAAAVTRLKLLATPYLCLAASLVFSSRIGLLNGRGANKWLTALSFAVVVAAASINGVANVVSERNVGGEFGDEPLEELLTWINASTETDAAFAGPMPITAAILLSAQRPIVNHPHYENANSRARTLDVYSMFSRQTPDELYAKLTKLKVTYLIVDSLWCFHRSTNGCAMLELWDARQPHLVGAPSLCARLFADAHVPHFHRAFANARYVALKLHERAVNVRVSRNYETRAM